MAIPMILLAGCGLLASLLTLFVLAADGTLLLLLAVKGQPGKAGTLVKTLRWSRAPDGNAYFINASVTDKGNNINNSVSVSLTSAEFYTFKRLVDFSIPYMLGWDAIFVSTQG
jgi:hypothetical protein